MGAVRVDPLGDPSRVGGWGLLDVSVLGPLEVSLDGAPIKLGSPKQRSILGILLAHLGQVVSSDRLIDEVWGEDSSNERHNALWVQISNLRKALMPEAEHRAEQSILESRQSGYCIEPSSIEFDAARFETLVGEGRSLVEIDPIRASAILGDALALWRGHAYSDFTYDSWSQLEITRLEELRLEAVECRVEADLGTGRGRELVGELKSLARQYPTREPLTASLMLSLYRSGRQAEALQYGALFRGRLVELGLEPSPALRRLEERIVADDPALCAAEHSGSPQLHSPSSRSVRGYEIRERLGDRESGVLYRAFQPSVGREVVIASIRPERADDPQFVRQFETEARRIAGLEHPNIVPIYDFWREPGAAYVVMRYLPGGTLSDRLTRGPLPHEELAQMADQLGAALETALRTGFVHGHIDAEQVLLDGTGNFYLSGYDGAMAGAVPTRPSGPGPPGSDLRDLAAVLAEAAAGRRGPIEDLVGEVDPQLAQILMTAGTHGDDRSAAAEFRRAVASVLHADRPPGAVVLDENPYKGLRSFEANDARDFFGREAFVGHLVARLSSTGLRSRFLAIVGPSGSGKSSVVKAGLVPAMTSRSDGWFTIEMTPGPHPFEELEAALFRVAVDPPPSLLDELTGAGGLNRSIELALPKSDVPLLLVVDQFEKLFTECSEESANRFLDALVSAVSDEHSRLRVLITLRADFYDRPLGHRAFAELLRSGTEILAPMSVQELERAVTGPATRVGVACEPALVSDLVAAVVERPSALPLLQYTLTELFAHRRDNTLSRADYRELGGVAGALVDRSEALFADMNPSERKATRLILLRLVNLDPQTGATTRRLLVSDLMTMTGIGRSALVVVESLARHRLLAMGRDAATRSPNVAISHDALLTEWKRLQRWIAEARNDILAERQLASATKDWSDNAGAPGFVLTNARLTRYSGWIDDPPVGLTKTEREFLAASEEAETQRQAEHDAQEQRDSQLRRRSRILVVLSLVAALLLTVGTFAAIEQRRASDLADQLAQATEARRIAAQAQLRIDSDPELALMLAVEAARITAEEGEVVPEVVDALHAGIQAARLTYPVQDVPVGVRAAAGGGVFLIDVEELLGLAQGEVDRPFTESECAAAGLTSCGDPSSSFPNGLEIAGGDALYATIRESRPLAGTRVRIVTPELGENLAGLQRSFSEFSEATGIEVTLRSVRANEPPISLITESTDEDIVMLPQPGALVGRTHRMIDLSTYLDRQELERAWSPYLAGLVSVDENGTWPSSDGSLYGVWTKLDAKSLIWYNVAEFESNNISTPSTWEDLIRISDRIAATGDAPFCIGLDSSGSRGWPATDIVESIVLRSGGPELYDRWVAHDIPFDHPSVIAAMERAGDLVFTPGYLPESAEAAVYRAFWEGPQRLTADPPQCMMVPLASFAPAFLNSPTGEVMDAFGFPIIDPAYAEGMVGAGTFAVALADRPEVREVMKLLASADFGKARADAQTGWIPAHADFDLELVPNATERKIARLTREATRSDSFRFDGSDLMPPVIGTDLVWQGMIDWFTEGPDALEGIMADIEEGWVEFEAEGQARLGS